VIVVTTIEMILQAMLAGAAAGTGEMAKSAVAEAYGKLRTVLEGRFGVKSVELANPDTNQLRQLLTRAGVDESTEVVTAARHVLELTDPEGFRAGTYNTVNVGTTVNMDTNMGVVAGTASAPITISNTFGERLGPTTPRTR
jgi:hypothetical protein